MHCTQLPTLRNICTEGACSPVVLDLLLLLSASCLYLAWVPLVLASVVCHSMYGLHVKKGKWDFMHLLFEMPTPSLGWEPHEQKVTVGIPCHLLLPCDCSVSVPCQHLKACRKMETVYLAPCPSGNLICMLMNMPLVCTALHFVVPVFGPTNN